MPQFRERRSIDLVPDCPLQRYHTGSCDMKVFSFNTLIFPNCNRLHSTTFIGLVEFKLLRCCDIRISIFNICDPMYQYHQIQKQQYCKQCQRFTSRFDHTNRINHNHILIVCVPSPTARSLALPNGMKIPSPSTKARTRAPDTNVT